MVDRAGLVDFTSGYNMPWALEKEEYTFGQLGNWTALRPVYVGQPIMKVT